MTTLSELISNFDAPDTFGTLSECDNCAFIAPKTEFDMAERLHERLDQGGVYTNIQCPHCGSLAYDINHGAESERVESLLFSLVRENTPKSNDNFAAINQMLQSLKLRNQLVLIGNHYSEGGSYAR